MMRRSLLGVSRRNWKKGVVLRRAHERSKDTLSRLRATSREFATTNASWEDRSLPDSWQKVADAQNKEQLLEAYTSWSQTYDHDSIGEYGYNGPRRGAEEFHNHLSNLGIANDVPLADIGAGTGLVGAHLHSYGYTHVTGLDFSPDMLKVASKKNCYKNLVCVDLNNSMNDILGAVQARNINAFDGIVSVGTFTSNHLGAPALLNVVGLLRPGGLLTITLSETYRNDSSHGIQRTLDNLVDGQRLKLLGVTEPELYTPKISDSIYFRVWSFQLSSSPT